jgi:putative endonuclease
MTYATNQLGRWGEERAARFLKKKRYKIVERNYRCRLGEIDIIARWRETLVFVEVKTRRDEEDIPPRYSVNRRKQLKIIRTARVYLKEHYLSGRKCRFDVVAIVAGDGKKPREIRHFPGAFRV